MDEALLVYDGDGDDRVIDIILSNWCVLSPVHAVAENGDCRQIRRLSTFSATVAVGDKLSLKSATIVASVDRLLLSVKPHEAGGHSSPM